MSRLPLLYPHMHKSHFPASDPANTAVLAIFTSITRLASRLLRPNICQDMENPSSQLLADPFPLNASPNPYVVSDSRIFRVFSSAEMEAFAQEREGIAIRLHCMQQLRHVSRERGAVRQDHLLEAARLGCLIYIHTVLWRSGPRPNKISRT